MAGKRSLTTLIFLGLLLGIVVGQLLYDPQWTVAQPDHEHAHATVLLLFSFVGFTVFMGLLKMLIIPLIAASVLVAVTGVGDFKRLGRLGGWALVYYFSTMLVAVGLGLILVQWIQPGNYLAEVQGVAPKMQTIKSEAAEQAAKGLWGIFQNLVRLMIPENIFKATVEGQTLSVIVFCIFFGVVVTMLGERGKIIVELAEAAFAVMMRMAEIVLWLAPAGVFCLLAWSIARIGLGVFGEAIGFYMITVIIGLVVHAGIVLPFVLWLFGRINPFAYMLQVRSAVLTAVSTSSSSATLPVTIECATAQGGVSRRAAGLVLPLGATINMDGTALYEAVAVVFMAQAFGIEMGGVQLLLIALTATLAAVGAAGIPSAGLVTMFIVIDAVNNSLQAASPESALIPAAAVGLVIGVDRILDMIRTGVNVWGDAVGAKLISVLDQRSGKEG